MDRVHIEVTEGHRAMNVDEISKLKCSWPSPSFPSPFSLYKKDQPRFLFKQRGQRERTEGGGTDGIALYLLLFYT
jgi:hypothetical protein